MVNNVEPSLLIKRSNLVFNINACVMYQVINQQEALTALKKRLEETTLPEFPRHRLRMLSKLSEGAFGTVSI